jgi:hypothetical protein
MPGDLLFLSCLRAVRTSSEVTSPLSGWSGSAVGSPRCGACRCWVGSELDGGLNAAWKYGVGHCHFDCQHHMAVSSEV